MGTTPNIGLHQWEGTDSFLRTDFNEDFGKIDSAIGTLTTKALDSLWGRYSGDDKPFHKVVLGFQPKFLVLDGTKGNAPCTAIFTPVNGTLLGSDQYESMQNYSSYLTFDPDGFTVRSADFMNKLNTLTHYFAMG